MKDINQKENKMEITKSEYIKLKVSEAKLNELEINGVDNWKNYGCMCNYLCEEEWDGECIFCTDDTDYEGFLDLQLGEDE
jgi:hypothetical protein